LFAQNVYCEVGEIVVVEMEAQPTVSDWQLQSDTADYSGTGYFVWEGTPKYGGGGAGLLSYSIKIANPGTYRFQWRTHIGNGTQNTEHNDAWLRISDADDFYGYRASTNSTVYPKGSGKTPNPEGAGGAGWFKIYMNTLYAWEWNTNTSDADPHAIYAVFNSPGIYTVEISARSDRFLIDKFVLYKEASYNLFAVKNAPASPINCDFYYQDIDGNGWGNPAVYVTGAQAGYVGVAGDCVDNDSTVNPGAVEICGNAIDENCDGIAEMPTTWYEDYDNDGYGNSAITLSFCGQPAGYVADSTDCNDSLATANPNANEIPGDGIDNNCNGQVDEAGTINSIRLINSTDDTIIQNIEDGDVIGMNVLPSSELNIDVITNVAVGGIVFTMTGAETYTVNENTAPYALFGDNGGDYKVWNPTMGNYTLIVDAYSGKNGGGTLLGSVTVNFTIQPTASSFPVNWLGFEAKQLDNQVNLTWQTASEQNNSHFIVERKEANQAFQQIGDVQAKGNSSQVSSYQMVDPTPPAGILQYRVKQIDLDGKFSYSQAIEIRVEAFEALQLFPNPSGPGKTLYLQGNLSQGREVNLSLISSTGQVVWQQDRFSLSDQGKMLPIPTLAAGMYFLRVQNTYKMQVLKLVVNP
ncbi:MAG: T9SS type A sorting domain-containing protein, partial [Bacteroidetes bacterium]|nr:T9SS type A sorting domain-containing protein [Bacteroidota bacterium]